MKTSEMMISVDRLTTCPWNPRGEITPESVADLTASIKARGLLQNIGVWKRPDADGYYVIFGNRRFVACVNAMMAEIRCRLFECSEVEAHEITRIENEARLGVSPIEDARLIGKMLDLGYSGKEIAAHFAISEAQVTRRRKLLDLSPAWESRARAIEIPTDALERVAAYPRAMQDKVLSRCSDWRLRDGWASLRTEFLCVAQDLDHARFVENDKQLAAKCKACPKRTGAQSDLFDDVKPGKFGRCLDAACFKKCRTAWKSKLLDDAIPGTIKERIEVSWSMELNNKKYTEKPKAGHMAAYYFFDDFNSRVIVKYGPSKAEAKAAAKKEQEARAAEKKKDAENAKNLDSACQKIIKWAKGKDIAGMAIKWATERGRVNPWKLALVNIYFALGGYYGPEEINQVEKGFLGKDPAASWMKLYSSEMQNTFKGVLESERMMYIARMFPEMLKGLTPEELKALKEDAR